MAGRETGESSMVDGDLLALGTMVVQLWNGSRADGLAGGCCGGCCGGGSEQLEHDGLDGFLVGCPLE